MFYGISTFVGYLMPNPFLFQAVQFSQTVLFQAIQFKISIVFFVFTQLNIKSVLFQTIKFSVSTFSQSKTVLLLTIHFSVSTQF